jgi:hypothetical protein
LSSFQLKTKTCLIISGLSDSPSPHPFNVIGDDDVFMVRKRMACFRDRRLFTRKLLFCLQQLDLPVDKNDSHGNGGGPESPLHSTNGKNILDSSQLISGSTAAGAEVGGREYRQLMRTIDKSENFQLGDDLGGSRDPDYSYVKFPPRTMVHEYSYPKIGDISTSKSSSPKARSGVGKNVCVKVFGGGGSSSASSTTSPPPTNSAFDEGGEKQKLHILSSQPLAALGGDDGKPPRMIFAPVSSDNSGGTGGVGGGGASSGDVLLAAGAELDAFGNLMARPHCVHCRESFSLSENSRGACAEAPCAVRGAIDLVTGVRCAKGLLYHCTADGDGDYAHPCACANADGHCVRRWFGMTLLSFLLPCLCCYPPLIGCYRCSQSCGLCGGKHQVAKKTKATVK